MIIASLRMAALLARHERPYLLSDAHKINIIFIMAVPLIRRLILSVHSTPLALSNRVRRLIYQATYTGMKETDLLLGHFARVHLPHLTDTDLDDFEALLDAGDPAILAWVMGNDPLPEVYDTPVFHLIKEFKKEQ